MTQSPSSSREFRSTAIVVAIILVISLLVAAGLTGTLGDWPGSALSSSQIAKALSRRSDTPSTSLPAAQAEHGSEASLAKSLRGASSNVAPTEFLFRQISASNGTALIRFDVPVFCRVRLEICNALGQSIQVPISGLKEARSYEYLYQRGNLAPGVYFCRFKALDAINDQLKYTKTERLIF